MKKFVLLTFFCIVSIELSTFVKPKKYTIEIDFVIFCWNSKEKNNQSGLYNMYKKIHNYIFTKIQVQQKLTAFFSDFYLIESILLA